jgi:hypothetical protein
MGQVATRFMPLYQAALAKKNGGAPRVSFEDYVAMSGAVPVLGYDGMLQHYRITGAVWTMIATQWNAVIPTSPQYASYGILVEQEAARLRAGGQPKPVSLQQTPQAPQAAPAQPYAQAPVHPQQPYPQPQPQAPYPYPQQPYAQPRSAQQLGADVGNAFNAFGSALGSFVDGAVGGFSVGARVMVQWSDGNRYPAQVVTSGSGQLEVAFPDGRRLWVPTAYVSMIY